MRIYIIGPLEKGEQFLNVRKAIQVGELLRGMGHHPMIPHLNMLWHMMFPHEVGWWLETDFAWLKVAEGAFRIPGESKNCEEEVKVARLYGIPVYFDLKEVPVTEAYAHG